MSPTDDALILIVDDDEAMRNSMCFLFASVGLQARAWDAADAFLADLPAPGTMRPGALVLDVRMPGMSGLELQRLLAARDFPLPIVIVTGHGDVQMAVEALKAGAFDFIEKPFKEQHLLDLVEAALRVSRARLTQDAQRREIAARLERLARREREVLEGILAGKANKVMAQDLDLSIKTIEGYRAAVMAKMQAGSVAELVRLIATLD
jgi:two-component system response regulator FixJ